MFIGFQQWKRHKEKVEKKAPWHKGATFNLIEYLPPCLVPYSFQRSLLKYPQWLLTKQLFFFFLHSVTGQRNMSLSSLHYSALKRKEILTFVTQMNLEDIMPSEMSQTQEDKNSMISLIYEILESQIYSNREENGGYQDWKRSKGTNFQVIK